MYDYRLPVLDVVKEAYRYAAHEWRALLRDATPLILLAAVLVLYAVSLFIFDQSQSDGSNFDASISFGAGVSIIPFIAVFVGFALAITYAVSVHRKYLLGTDDTGILNNVYWRRRHSRFLG